MSFELEDSEEDISANLDGGHGTMEGGMYPTGASTPLQDEYDFELEDSTSRADSPAPPTSPPSPQPPPVPMPPMRPVAMTGASGKNRFKPQPEVMRRQQSPAYEEEEEGEGEGEEEGALYSTLDGGGGIYEPRGMVVQLDQQQQQQQHQHFSFAAPPTYSPRGGSGVVVEEEEEGGLGDGEVEDEYSSDMVEAITSPAPGFLIPTTLTPALLLPGTRVWGLYRSGEEWFEGVVVAGNGDGTWVVSYGEDDEEEAVPLQRMRWVVEGGRGGGAAALAPRPISPPGEPIRDTSSPYSYTQDAFDEDVDSPTTSPRAQHPLSVGIGGSAASPAAAAAAVASPAYSTPGSYLPSPPLSSPPTKPTIGGTPGGFAGGDPLQQQQQQQQSVPPFPIGSSTSGASGGSYLPPLPPGYTYAAVPLPSLSSSSSFTTTNPTSAPPPPPPPYPSVGGGFHGGLMGIALALAQASPLLNLGSSSLASVINTHFGGGVPPATLQEAFHHHHPTTTGPLGVGLGSKSSASASAGAGAGAGGSAIPPPPPPPLQTAPTSAFLQALSAGLKLSGEGSTNTSNTPTPTYAPLHPAVAKALASAQATLATHDTLYARQLEALREAASRTKGRVQHMKERAGWGGIRPPGGGSPTSSSQPPLVVPAPPPPVPFLASVRRGTGQEGRVPGGLSFQEALAIVKREGVRRDAAAAAVQ